LQLFFRSSFRAGERADASIRFVQAAIAASTFVVAGVLAAWLPQPAATRPHARNA